MATKLDNIFLEDKKIFVNIPHFSRRVNGDSEISKRGEVKHRLGIPRVLNQDVMVKDTKFKLVIIKGDNRSFAQVVNSKFENLVEVSSESVQGRGVEKLELLDVVFDNVDSIDLAILQKALVDVVKVPGFTFELQDTFLSEGFFSILVTPLGPNLYLL